MPLDPSQRSAATCDAPAQLTLAGPGSGKTSTLTGRFIHLVRQGVDPRRILAVTFTKKAVEEMRQRISAALPDLPPKQLEIFTFHGFAYRCLRRNPAAAGLPSTIQLWNAPEQRAVFSKRRMYWNEDEDILDIIGSAKERLLDAKAFEASLGRGDEVGKSAVEFFRVYEEALNRAGAIDFADMVPRLVQAMDRDLEYGRSIVSAYDHLLVDEYQDVNPGQDLLIAHFVRAGVKLWAVGDDDQTLYAFRASDVGYILDFQERYPGSQVHILNRNYRSAPGIVRIAKKLIRKNEGRVDKDYSAVNQGSCDIVVRGYSMPAVEARQVATGISQLISKGVEPRQMAVLYRSGTIGLHFQAALRALDIPFEVRGAGDFWQSSPAKLFVGSLYYLRDPKSAAALEKMGTGKRGDITRERLNLIDRRTRRDFQSSCAQVQRIVAEALPIRAAGRERAEWESIVDGVAMLAYCPIRLKNFSALELGRSFARERDRWAISLPGREVKNGRTDLRLIRARLNPAIGLYLTWARPWLMRHTGEFMIGEEQYPLLTGPLWIGQYGEALSYGSVERRIMETTRSVIGRTISPHDFRRSGAFTARYRAGSEPHLASGLLQHQNKELVDESYNLASSLEVADLFGGWVDDIAGS